MGVRDKIRPASAGHKNAWSMTPQKELPRAPAHGTTTCKSNPLASRGQSAAHMVSCGYVA